jgi:hypothetical protein
VGQHRAAAHCFALLAILDVDVGTLLQARLPSFQDLHRPRKRSMDELMCLCCPCARIKVTWLYCITWDDARSPS